MAPMSPHVISQLRHLIYYHLDNDLVQNALFLAGRLHAYDTRSAESTYLVALCHLRLGQSHLAYECSKLQGSRGAHLGCAYVFAQACLLLPLHQKEGIAALERSRGLWGGRNNWNKHSESTRRSQPDAAAISCLLAKLWHGYGDTKKAVDYYVEALKLNPFMWDAFLGLCDTGMDENPTVTEVLRLTDMLGANIRIPQIFKMTPEMTAMLTTTTSSATASDHPSIPEESPPTTGPLQSQHNNNNLICPPTTDPFASSSRTNGDASLRSGVTSLFRDLPHASSTGSLSSSTALGGAGGLGFEGMETPTGPNGSLGANFILGGSEAGGVAVAAAPVEAPHAPVRKPRHFPGIDVDGPARLRTVSAKSRGISRSETEDASEGPRAGVSTMVGGERKRTISGQVTQASSSHVSDPLAAPQRRSVRLFNQIRPTSTKFSASTGSIGAREGRELKRAKATGTKGRTGGATGAGSTMGRVVSGNRKPFEPTDGDSKENMQSSGSFGHSAAPAKSATTEAAKQQEALQWLLDLFGRMGSAYFALTHFQCPEALRILHAIPSPQRDTVWVLSQMGRAHYEQGSYVEAEKIFRKVRTISPSRLEDMEIYSTILWHLKEEVELAYLAHELVDIDRLSPQAWCAIGNTFSLQREHDQALKCFKRATQLDSNFAYAFTHQGHEHVTNEEYDKALAAYRSGIAVDHRYYNAWYGLGKVYEKLGKYDVAEKHYRTAAGINPTNAVLVCCIGMVLEKLKNPRAALEQYVEACRLAPRSTISRFKKARVLLALHEPQQALTELKVLKDLVPDEANVHFLLGKAYKTLRQRAHAIKYYTIALNLDPKAGQLIKDAIESIEEDDIDDGEMSP